MSATKSELAQLTHEEATKKLRAAAIALRDLGREIQPRTGISFAWAFGPHGRVAMLWVAPPRPSADEFLIHVSVDALSDRDREAPATVFDERSTTKDIVEWVLSELCLRA